MLMVELTFKICLEKYARISSAGIYAISLVNKQLLLESHHEFTFREMISLFLIIFLMSVL